MYTQTGLLCPRFPHYVVGSKVVMTTMVLKSCPVDYVVVSLYSEAV
jgi:hypothetical protein